MSSRFLVKPSPVATPKDLAVLGLACVALATAVWLIPASVHIVDWRDRSVVRVALLAPLARFAWSLGLTFAAGAATAAWWMRGGRRPLAGLTRLVAPLVLLFLWVAPYVPWLPGRFPLFLLLAGPLRWFVAALAVGGCLWQVVALLKIHLPDHALPGRRTVFVTSLVVFLGLGLYVKQAQGLGGDEPHYLVIAHSLMADGDLQIENNHAERHYADFFGGALAPDFLRRGREGVIYSIHSPGLPALLLPAYAAGGHWGAAAIMCLLAALAVLAVFDLAEALASRAAALITSATFAFTIPFGVHSWLIYPGVPVALVMAWVAIWLWKPLPERAWPWFWRGVALALLPWLHTKFVVLLIAATAWLLIRLWPRGRASVLLVAPIGVSVSLWLYSFYVMYGVVNPLVAYGYSAGAQLASANIPRGVLGLLFDQEYGLLLYTPAYLLALPGWWLMVRHPGLRWYGGGLAVVVALFVAGTTRTYMWWGGSSPPARFLVPVLPLLAPMIAVAVRDLRGPVARGAMGLAVGSSLTCFAVVVAQPALRLMYNDRDGIGGLMEAVQAGVPLTSTLPTLLWPEWAVQLPSVAVWVASGVLMLLIAGLTLRRFSVAASPFWGAALGFVVFGFTASLLAGVALPTVNREAVQTEGRMRLLAAYDGPRQHAVEYETLDRLSDEALFGRAVILRRLASDDGEVDRGRLAGPFNLAAGRYEVRVWFGGRGGPEGEVWLMYHRGPGVIARTSASTRNPAVLTLDLPVDVSPVWLGASDQLVARAISHLEIVPEALVPRGARAAVGARVRAMDLIDDHPGGYVFYVDDNIWPESGSSWVRGGWSGSLLVSPAGASEMRVTIRNGATGGIVGVVAAGLETELRLSSWETRALTVSLTGDEALVPVVVSPAEGFRPAQVDPASNDRRWLGCQVTIGLF